METSRPAVVVTNAGHPTGLGVARALSHLRVGITGLCRDPHAPTCRSRHWTRLIPVLGGAEARMDVLLEMGPKLSGRPVLFPIEDDLVLLISEHRAALEPFFRFVLPDQPAVEVLMDKTLFSAWAAERGFPVPEAKVIPNENELRQAMVGAQFPLVLKPPHRTPAWQARSPREKVFRLDGPEGYDAIGFDVFETVPRVLLQRWISGGDSNVRFCLTYRDRNGRRLGSYAGRKLLQWPPGTGSTAVCVGTVDPELQHLTDSLFDEAGLCGLGSLEVKQAAEDGAYWITEPTVGRVNLQSNVAAAGGVNLVELAYYDAIRVTDRWKRPRARGGAWIHEEATLAALVGSERSRSVPWGKLARAVATAKVSFAYLSLVDPLPFLSLCARRVSQYWRNHAFRHRG